MLLGGNQNNVPFKSAELLNTKCWMQCAAMSCGRKKFCYFAERKHLFGYLQKLFAKFANSNGVCGGDLLGSMSRVFLWFLKYLKRDAGSIWRAKLLETPVWFPEHSQISFIFFLTNTLDHIFPVTFLLQYVSQSFSWWSCYTNFLIRQFHL